jgi:hypothetical protein
MQLVKYSQTHTGFPSSATVYATVCVRTWLCVHTILSRETSPSYVASRRRRSAAARAAQLQGLASFFHEELDARSINFQVDRIFVDLYVCLCDVASIRKGCSRTACLMPEVCLRNADGSMPCGVKGCLSVLCSANVFWYVSSG